MQRSAHLITLYFTATVAADHDINLYLPLLRTNGTYINVGMPLAPLQVPCA